MAAVIDVLGRGRRTERDRPVAKFHVRFETQCPNEDTVESVRSRMGLLNEAMRRTIRGASNFEVVDADYERGVLELYVWTDQVRGIETARVAVSIERLTVTA